MVAIVSIVASADVVCKGFFNNSGEGIDIIENLNTKHRVPIIIMNELYLKKQEKRKLENKQ